MGSDRLTDTAAGVRGPSPRVLTRTRVYWPDNQPTCYACAEPLQPVDGGWPRWEGSGQYQDALEVTVTGGYGMFIDPQDSGGSHTVFLCGGCARASVAALPWLADLIGHAPHPEGSSVPAGTSDRDQVGADRPERVGEVADQVHPR